MLDGAGPWASDMLTELGETLKWASEVEGVHDYACTSHEATDMNGRVIVGWPDLEPDTQPTLEPPQDGLPGGAGRKFEEYKEQTLDVLEE